MRPIGKATHAPLLRASPALRYVAIWRIVLNRGMSWPLKPIRPPDGSVADIRTMFDRLRESMAPLAARLRDEPEPIPAPTGIAAGARAGISAGDDAGRGCTLGAKAKA